jgi:hypothetical protein
VGSASIAAMMIAAEDFKDRIIRPLQRFVCWVMQDLPAGIT